MKQPTPPSFQAFPHFKNWRVVGKSGGVFLSIWEENGVMKRGFHFVSALCLLVSLPAFAGVKNSDCLDCHGDNTLFKTNAAGKAISMFVDAAKLK